MRKISRLFAFALLLLSLRSFAEEGVTKSEVKVGMTCGLTGTLAPYMKVLVEGMHVAIDKVNAGGGVHGRKIKHIVVDDAYDAPAAFENAKKLVNQEKVFAILGGAGTATSKAFIPFLAERGVPFLFPITGGLGHNKVYFNVRATYLTETDSLVEFAIKSFPGKSVGVFYQDDAFGVAGRNGVAKVLAQHGLKLAGEGKYDRTSFDIAPGIAEILKTKPDIVYLQTLPRQALEFIKATASAGYRPTVLATSIVNSADLIKVLGKDATNIFVSQVLPTPADTQYALARDFVADMQAAGKDASDPTAMEGYTAVRVFAEALKRSGKNLTRQRFIDAMEGMANVDVGGLKLNFSKNKHFGLDRVFIVRLHEGKRESL